MTKQVIRVGTAINDGTGDTLRQAGIKINDNFTELYQELANVGYSLPVATSSNLGGVKVGGTLTISDGVLNVVPYALPTASTEVKGGVKVDGTSITISNGVISANLVANQLVPFRMPLFTTTERNSLSAENGDIIYNSTTNSFQGYQNGAWVDLAITVVDGGTSAD